MQLPDFKVEIKELELGGIKLNFRKAIVADIEFGDIIKDFKGALANFRLLAHLMVGYEKTEEELFDFLKTIPIPVFESILITNNMLAELGIIPPQKEEIKKKEIESSPLQ